MSLQMREIKLWSSGMGTHCTIDQKAPERRILHRVVDTGQHVQNSSAGLGNQSKHQGLSALSISDDMLSLTSACLAYVISCYSQQHNFFLHHSSSASFFGTEHHAPMTLLFTSSPLLFSNLLQVSGCSNAAMPSSKWHHQKATLKGFEAFPHTLQSSDTGPRSPSYDRSAAQLF